MAPVHAPDKLRSARLEKEGLGFLIDSLQLVEACRRIIVASGAPGFIENPKGRLNTIWREPDFRFHPSDYAGYLEDKTKDAYTKETCLWAFNGYTMPPKKAVVPMGGSKMHLLPPSLKEPISEARRLWGFR